MKRSLDVYGKMCSKYKFLTNEQKYTGETKCNWHTFFIVAKIWCLPRCNRLWYLFLCFVNSCWSLVIVSWLFCFLCFWLSVILTGSYNEEWSKLVHGKKLIHPIKLYVRTRYWSHMTSLPKQNQRIIMIKTYKKGKNQIRRPALVFDRECSFKLFLEKLDVETTSYLKYEGLRCLSCVRHLLANSS